MQKEGRLLLSTVDMLWSIFVNTPCSIFAGLLQLGTHLRAKKKREEMGNLLRKAKK